MAFQASDYSRWVPLEPGGQAQVYRARQDSLDRWVAVKVFRDAPAQSARERCREEARRSASLSHPALVPVLDSGPHGDGWVAVYEFVRGCPLGEVLELGPDLACGLRYRIARQMAEVGQYLELEGVLHRDYKPDNFRLEPAGRLRLVDFGLASARISAPKESARNAGIPADANNASVASGTLAYLAPECLLRGAEASPASDRYALCLTLLEWLNGRRAFPQSDFGSLTAAVAAGPASAFFAGLEPDIAAHLRPFLSGRPEERPRDLGALVEALSETEASHPLPLGDRSAGLLRLRVEERESAWLRDAGFLLESEGRIEEAWSLARERMECDHPDEAAAVDCGRLASLFEDGGGDGAAGAFGDAQAPAPMAPSTQPFLAGLDEGGTPTKGVLAAWHFRRHGVVWAAVWLATLAAAFQLGRCAG